MIATRIKKSLILFCIVALIAFIISLPFSLTLFGVFIFDFTEVNNTSNLSLTIGKPYNLPFNKEDVLWKSNNHSILVEKDGSISAKDDYSYPKNQAIISGYCQESENLIYEYRVTTVPWIANNSKLEIVDIFPKYDFLGIDFHPPLYLKKTILVYKIGQLFFPSYTILGTEDGALYYSVKKRLYKTYDGFQTSEFISKLPFIPGKSRMIIAPFGYFIRSGKSIYMSQNLNEWQIAFKSQYKAWLMDNMDYWYDHETKKGYLYVSEYSTGNPKKRHNIYRGIFTSDGNAEWSIIHSLYSLHEQKTDENLFLKTARHYHLVKVDSFTGDVWIGTGDSDIDAMILYSNDFGENFNIMGFGSQQYRTLGIWFTKNYIYWNMDTGSPPQNIYRLDRKILFNVGSLTPILNHGESKVGIRYYVVKNENEDYFPVGVSSSYIETEERKLNHNNIVLAFNDPNFDKKELVAELTNGSHFSVFDILNEDNKIITLMAGTAEGFTKNKTRDPHGRIFGINELPDGKIDIQELISIPSFNQKFERVRMEAIVQDSDGFIYFQTFGSRHGDSILKGKLTWEKSK